MIIIKLASNLSNFKQPSKEIRKWFVCLKRV